MKKAIFTKILVIMVFITTSVLAAGKDSDSPGSIYVGAGIGNTFFSSEAEDALNQIQEISENSTAWKIFGGYRAHKFIGIEGGYRSFGDISTNIGNVDYKSETTGWDIEALGLFQIAIVDVFGKAGVMFSSTETSAGGASADDNSTDFFWGLGAGVHLGPFGARLEWESIVVEGPTNLSMVSLSATFGFTK
ncbi:MAG: outer membrane beta-barrel protein [Ignavibacteria bacterium]